MKVSIFCKATAVIHTKRNDHNLLRKETSFMCYTSAVLRKSWHMKKKRKNYALLLRSKLKITKIEHSCNSSTKHSYNTVQRTQIATAIRHFWLTKHTLRI